MAKGHTLVIPKHEVDYMMDLTEDEYQGLWAFARRVALAIKPALHCKRVGVAVLGMEVPHCHIHLVPLNRESDMDFRKEKLSLSADEMKAVAESIAANFK